MDKTAYEKAILFSNFSDKVKSKLLFVHNNIKETKFGTPIYNNSGPFSNFSWLSFFFGMILYLFKGLWRKSLACFGLCYLLNLLVFVLKLPPACMILTGLAFNVWFGINYYNDLYRRHILRETFWL